MSSDNHPAKIRVMLVDDHLIVRMGLSFAINNQPDMQVVAQAEDGHEAIEVYRQHQPDVVILDLRMPKRNGIETIGVLRREFGAVRVLVLSNYGSGDEVSAALQAGASGFIGKDTALAELLDAIRKIRAGDQVVPSEVARRLASRITSHLSTRELEVLALIGRGLSNKEIGAALNVVESTVKVHVTNILSKLGVADRTQAVLAGVKRGIIQLE
ncbi:response regulator [Opitutus terrae]|uniref:Two component transcriptional regulator, LuxR family n=1 Tax=Opitutus terrae (strain DSM 11246 / JCM 15787 / PB90-1) TaxID=452637 RepID=B1ZSY9_OPITP|nr:response regulator transcription factor [Opitutus terrae]ACB75778.1 two component transcriptional regulator, LuxR family [Opitutus terrae PB90-1]